MQLHPLLSLFELECGEFNFDLAAIKGKVDVHHFEAKSGEGQQWHGRENDTGSQIFGRGLR